MSSASLETPLVNQPIDPPRRPDTKFLLGDYSIYFADEANYFLDTGKVGPMVRFRLAHLDHLLVTDAEFAKEILQTRNKNYLKEPRLMKIIESGAAQTLFSSDGDEWIWRRRLMQPAFHKKQIAAFCDAILNETEKMVDSWNAGEMHDMDEAMKMVTMMIIGRTMFNVDMDGDSADLHWAYRTLSETLISRITSPIQTPAWMPTKANRDFQKCQEIITTTLSSIMNERRHATEPQNDLLEMLLTMVDVEDGFTQEQMIFEMSSIVFAGHETTAATLAWILYVLTEHPDVEAKLLEEIDTVIGDRRPTMDDLEKLPYLNMVINETLRMYPPARATNRQAIEADELGGYKVRAGEAVFINIEGIQKDERYWDNPLQFDPERWTAERSANRHKWAFLPFLDGPRKCIGEPLSRTEMQLILVTMLKRFRFVLPAGAKVEKKVGFVLQPSGLEMILEPR